MKGILLIILLIPVICVTACAGPGNTPDNWTVYQDPKGFTLSHPEGWNVTCTEDGQIRIGSNDAVILIRPFFSKEEIPAETWTKRVPDLFTETLPEINLNNIKRARSTPDEMYADFRFNLRGTEGAGALLCSVYKGSGIFYIITSVKDRFLTDKKTMISILKTFRFVQPSVVPAAQDTGLAYTRWSDPKENAFSTEVPSGWEVGGGLFRFASVDIRPAVTIVSPDRDIFISGGDNEIPPFAVPSQMLLMTGFREGSWYSPGYGVNMMVKTYLDGRSFAREYVVGKAALGCNNLKFTAEKDRPDVSGVINEINRRYGVYGIQTILSTGEVAFTCEKNGKPYEGYYFAGTRLTTAYGGGTWNMEYLFGFLAERSKAGIAREVLSRMVKTFTINPRWMAMQTNLAAATSEIVSKTHNEISDIINRSYEYRQGIYDDLGRKWSNAILGLTDVRDPETGETWKVASGRNYYWRKSDTVVGTDTYDRPDIDFTPLLEF